MVEVLFSFTIILIVCTMTGVTAAGLLRCLVGTKVRGFGVLVAGIVSITVITGYLSIFTKIGMLATLLVLVIDVVYAILNRKEYTSIIRRLKDYFAAHKWEAVYLLFVATIISYFTSRGNFHTDTNLYHAANIRIFEEAGLIKGMTNLFNNYGYNSMYHAFCAFFSEHWMLNKPWHTTSGFLAFIFSSYAIHNLKELNSRRVRLSDAGCFAILVYILNILYYVNSPATDYAAMLFALYMMTEWLRVRETTKDVNDYANLCVLAVYILTLKISAGLIVIAAIYPLVLFCKEKKIRDIVSYLTLGIIVALPYFIRNYFISGWLVYPFKGIDIFNVKWKTPVDILDMDVSIISGSGKCLFDMPADLPITEWVPIWWSSQEFYGKMLFLSCVFAVVVLLIHEAYKLVNGKRDFAILAILAGNFASLLLWFVQAPFIRYGLAFLLFTPCLAVAVYLSEKRNGIRRIIMGTSAVLIVLLMTPFVDHYFGDDIGFISMHKSAPYYIFQKDYDVVETTKIQVGEVIINCGNGSVNSYHAYPSTISHYADSRLDALGDTFEEGFYMHE